MAEQIKSLPRGKRSLAELQEACDRFQIELAFELPKRFELEMNFPTEAERTWLADADSQKSSRQCDIAWTMPHVDSSGKVFPCCRAAAVNQEQVGDLNVRRAARLLHLHHDADRATGSGDAEGGYRRC